ncbi:hypothetical protein CY34DRAFT_454950 [Suillus luteus UH-Slu-Lm8-n1]|uniref:Uncharacterized protein n=1 Tax=Suillus luteus UH-Slu-Lm8-n1 TaxID=930992 RepID=A0A0D0ATC2_9AGAM|nr:hypothetical protein CY34DRAFT_454950 [Suillus luteus UH-Slu-Lm8-n1]
MRFHSLFTLSIDQSICCQYSPIALIHRHDQAAPKYIRWFSYRHHSSMIDHHSTVLGPTLPDNTKTNTIPQRSSFPFFERRSTSKSGLLGNHLTVVSEEPKPVAENDDKVECYKIQKHFSPGQLTVDELGLITYSAC